MRQRVSLGRMLAYQPDVMPMDEPFGALDFQTKAVMGRELLHIWEPKRRSILFVTHDIEEAVALADRVLVFSPHPARIIAEHRIGLPRPRNLRTLRGSFEIHRLHLRNLGGARRWRSRIASSKGVQRTKSPQATARRCYLKDRLALPVPSASA